MFKAGNRVAIVKALDEEREELASAKFDRKLEITHQVDVIVEADSIRAQDMVKEGSASLSRMA